MTIKNEKYLPRLKKTAKKKRKIQTEKNTSHTKKNGNFEIDFCSKKVEMII
jgi:ribonuclease HI